MKQISIITAILALAGTAFGQGQMQFQNRVTAVSLFAPIYGVNPAAPTVRMSGMATTNGGTVDYTGVPLLAGTGFTAGLYYGTNSTDTAAFGELATALFQTATTLPGIIRGPTTAPTVPGITVNNTPGNFQIRAWDNRGGTLTTWAAALGANPPVATGHSELLANLPVTVAPTTPVASLTGLTSFNLTIVPEPSLIALGALGLGALLLRRRKA